MEKVLVYIMIIVNILCDLNMFFSFDWSFSFWLCVSYI